MGNFLSGRQIHPNEELLIKFYTCFQNKDYKGMQECYAGNAVFNDPVFKNLDASEVCAMWEMLLKRGKDLRLKFSNVKANDLEGSAKWIAKYTFSASGRQVENHIQSKFRFSDGKIIAHNDQFDFYLWSRQALGLPGWLWGWTRFLQNKVQKNAMQGLHNYIEKEGC
ncbi:nuclear transport factor 2 family protein [Flavihumibacter profundi]|uniref:nuclear transport factor 2 family protein n=1 Tax=Flavihumibacter profundi TaxID=2716883 RepID=UPI001CC67CC1|nr:nuclear transport factor 2 family protein [Flavihumibacter profundi]MBZ5855968.1 nuclear transport factor 2 family protein [Flavihumibacter profundi]